MSRQNVYHCRPWPAGALELKAEQLIALYPGNPRIAIAELQQHIEENKEKYRELEYKPAYEILEDAEQRIIEANREG